MDAKRAREGQTPGRTPGKNDFRRPTFALGRISFGVDDDSSSCSSSSFSAEDSAFGAARSKALSPISSGKRVPLAPAAGAENIGGGGGGGGGGVGTGPWKMSSNGGGGGGNGRASVLADRSLRENARVDMDEDQERRRSPFSSPAVGPARHAGGGGGGGGHPKAAAMRPQDCRRRSLNESWGSPVVAGESGREEISPSPAAVSGKTPRDRRDCADPARGNGLPPTPPPEKDGAAVPSEAGAARRAGAAAPGEDSPALGTGSPGDVGAGSEDFPEAWDDGGGMYVDYGDDFGSGGVYTYSPSPPRSSAVASAAGMGAGSSSFRSSFGGPVSSGKGNSSSNARDSAGGKSAASSPVDTSDVLDLSASSPPPPPPTSRFSKEALPPKSPTVASGNRKGQASERFVVCSDDDDDDFVDCLEVEEAGNAIPAGRSGGARDRGWSGTGPKNPPSKHGSFGGSGSGGGGGGGRFGLGNSGSLAGGPAARQPSKDLGRGLYSSSSSSEDDDSDDFSMVVSTKRGGSGVAAHTAGASAGTFAGPAAGRASLGDSGRYGDLVVGAAGEWQREAGGEAWKMAASGGGGGNASGGRESDDDESDDYELTPRKKKEAFSVPAELYNRMYAHQRIGVRWLWSLHQGDMGGILGDDMGLGKTFQVTCFLAGLFGTRQAKSALVLAPKSVMRGWEDELGRWLVKAACPKAEVVVMASEMPAKARRRAIALAAEGGSLGRGAVLITTYGMVSSNPKQFAPAVGGSGGWIEREEPRKHVWDYVILDEGHKIKNASTKTCKAVHWLPTKRRLLLTGTPVQNNLKELHTVVDWATFGKLLGPYKYFKKAFSRPIEYGQDRDASEKAVLRSRARAAELRQMLEPLLLQRTKGEIMDEKATTKTEMVVWVALSPLQRKVYVKYLGGESVKGILSGEVSSPLGAIAHLKKVCLHPLVSSYPLDEPWMLDPEVSVSSLLKDCNKLEVTLNIVKEACSAGHRVLVFSRFVRMLDILERCINEDRGEGGAGLRVCRIDGGHSDLERQHTIARFNANNKISVCLVSTGAGGTGITLTGADRVILFDPSWNPADDMQAVDRAYRIGQKRDVIVYRMIAAGTVEEKMYEKQIFKDGLRRTVMGGTVKRKKNVRYFSRSELKQLFTLYPAGACRVLDQLHQMHGPLSGRLEAAESRAQRDISLDGHLNFVCGLRGAYGASAHGDGLPKIVQQPAAEGGSGGGGGGEGGWHTRNQIDEEEDESDVEDSDGAGAGARGMRGGGMHGLLEEDLIALELDLDDGDDDDEDDGGATMAPRAAGRKGKGPSRLLRRHQPSGMESSSSGDDVVEGGSRAVLDLSVAGADRSTAIALSGDSDSECEFGGRSKGHDVVELMDDDDDDDGRADGKVSVGLPRTPVAINDSGGACGSSSVEASREGLGTPESWSVSPPPPGSPPPIGGGSAHNDSPMSAGGVGGGGGGGCESSGSNSQPLWEWNDQEEMGYEEEKETMGELEEPGDSASVSSPFTSGHSIVGDLGGGMTPAFSAKKEEEGEASAAVRAGRERARRWANDELGISPVASSSSSGRGGGGGCGSTVGDTAEEDETLRRASDASRKVSAARKRAREFAVEELGAEMGGDGRHRLSRSYSSGDDDGTERCNPRHVQVEEEQRHGGYRSSDDSMDGGVEAVALYDGGGSDEGEGLDRSSTGGNAEDGYGAEEEETVPGGSLSSAIVMLDSSSSPARAAAPGEPSATADDSPGTTTTNSGRRWNDGNAAAPYSSSFPPLVGAEEGSEAVGDQSPPNDPLLSATPTPTPNKGDGDGGPTPALDAADRGRYGGAWPQSVRSSASSRSSYATAGSSHPQDVDGVAAVVAESRGDGSLGGHERGDGDVGSSSGPKACFASPSSGGGGAERSPDGGAACDKGQRSGSKGFQEAPAELSPVPPAPTSAPSSPAATAAAADGAHFAPPAAAAAAVCAAHKAAAESAGFTCRRCSCAAGAEAAEQAKGLLLEAWSNEREGDMYAAMGVCLEAIKLCDEDMELHKTISRVGSRMGCLS